MSEQHSLYPRVERVQNPYYRFYGHGAIHYNGSRCRVVVTRSITVATSLVESWILYNIRLLYVLYVHVVMVINRVGYVASLEDRIILRNISRLHFLVVTKVINCHVSGSCHNIEGPA